MLLSASSRLMVPPSVEILPSMTERDLLTSEPALRAPRALADPTADSISSRTLWGSGKPSASPSSCVRCRFQLRSIFSRQAALQLP